MIVAANAVALAIAWWQRWPMAFLLLSYWAQSLIIGWYGRRRLLAVRRFVYGRTRYDLDAGGDERATVLKRNMLNSATAIWAFYHAVYLVFLIVVLGAVHFTGMDVLGLAFASLSFLLAHHASYHRNKEGDRAGCPTLRALTFLPLIRVVPMHLTMVFGFQFTYGLAIAFFGVLKTVADVVLHRYEHRVLALD